MTANLAMFRSMGTKSRGGYAFQVVEPTLDLGPFVE